MRMIVLTLAAVATMGATSPGMAQRSPRLDWNAGPDGDDRRDDLDGPGVRELLPELRKTRRGRAFVLRNFDDHQDGVITTAEARAANRGFLRGGGIRRFGHLVADTRPAISAAGGPTRFPQPALRSYGFRDVAGGAQTTMQEDVLFRTASAELRPGAVEKLRALAGYLRDHPGVRVAIDGHTDSRGADSYNRELSDRRARNVRSAFVAMGVTEARFRVRGHGEADPVAPNDGPENMRRNRRVEITLLGLHARDL